MKWGLLGEDMESGTHGQGAAVWEDGDILETAGGDGSAESLCLKP